jgi:glycosyltransferase (TIGR04182 family)
MVDPGDVTVLVPTRNEAAAVGDVLERLADEGFADVLVVDGDSTDGTPEIAREHGARVVQQTGSGKGQAVRQGVAETDAEYLLMLDGDGTYRPEDADRFLDALAEGADHVVGDRFADMQEGAMTRLNQVGNRVINSGFRFVHGRDLGDILSGYRAFTRESVERMDLTADGFGIETEMAVECVKHDVDTAVVPVTYEPRPAGAETNLRPFRDGAVILLTLYQLARRNNPLFYFGSLGVLSGAAGTVIGAYVAVEWFTRRVPHEILAVVGAFAILLGLQLVMFGVLSDLIVTLHREQMRRFDRERDR